MMVIEPTGQSIPIVHCNKEVCVFIILTAPHGKRANKIINALHPQKSTVRHLLYVVAKKFSCVAGYLWTWISKLYIEKKHTTIQFYKQFCEEI